MGFDSVGKKSLGELQDFAAVGSVAVSFEMRVGFQLEVDVVSLGWVGGRCCECPAHVLLP